MSGTSCDGVDAALIETTGRGDAMTARYRHHVERPFDAEFRQTLLKLREAQACSFAELATLGRELTLAYAAAVRDLLVESNVRADDVAAVAAHGQTLFHDPPNTIQWLDPSLLAAETGIAVVSDFRRADCAAGGQGAPLVPFGDWVFFRHPEKTRVILNLGGIANLTYLPAGGGIDDIIAFDTGPGCCLIDHVMRVRGGGGVDDGGRLALAGQADQALPLDFRHEACDGYSKRSPPKSTDGPAWIRAYERAREQMLPRLHLEELHHELATVTQITASFVADAIASTMYNSDDVHVDLVVAGGGAKNAALLDAIREEARYLNGTAMIQLLESQSFGLPSQAREAACFAVMGSATLDGEPSNVPSATGARRRVVLGSITPAPREPR